MIEQNMQPIDLADHPEGGRFREVFRSATVVSTQEGATKAALTHIYFSLNPGEMSRFHKVSSDEVWNLYRGDGLRLYTWDGTNTAPRCNILSAEEDCFCHVVPAGTWQAAEPISGAVLAGCSVAPGFEFSDFQIMGHDSEHARLLTSLDSEMTNFISR